MVRQSPRQAPGTPPSLNTLMPISPFGSHPRVSSSRRHPLSYPDVPAWPCTAPPSSGSPTVFLSPATDGKYGALLSPISVRRLLEILCNWTIGPEYVASGSSLSRCGPAAVRDLARAEATCDRTSIRSVISFTKGAESGGRRGG